MSTKPSNRDPDCRTRPSLRDERNPATAKHVHGTAERISTSAALRAWRNSRQILANTWTKTPSPASSGTDHAWTANRQVPPPALPTFARCARRSLSASRALARRAAWRSKPEVPAVPPRAPNTPARCIRKSCGRNPASCPICGMALEPRTVTAHRRDNPELRDMTRRFWVSLVLTAPLLVMAMAPMIWHGLKCQSRP